MKQFERITRLGAGLLVMMLSLISERPILASQGSPAAVKDKATQTSQLVTLVCGAFTANICTDLERVAADGTLTPYSAPPSGSVLVVTDFVWKAASVSPGQVAFATLHHQLTSPPHDVAFSAVVATSDGAAVSESHFITGLPFSDLPIVFVSHVPNVVILQGYFAAE